MQIRGVVKQHAAQVCRQFETKKPLTAQDLDPSYEEIFSNWRNKMHHAADCGDAYLSLMTAMSCQGFYDEMFARFQMEHIDVMGHMVHDDLPANAQAFDRSIEQYRKEYTNLEKPLGHYATLEEFEKDYLK